MDWVLKHWALIAFAFNLLCAWGLWSMAQKFATKKDIDDLKEKVGGQVSQVSSQVSTVSSRVDVIESDIRHLPTSAALHETNIQLTKLLGAMEAAGRDYRHVLDRQTRLEDAMIRHENIMSDAARMTASARKSIDDARRRSPDERS